jgi:hypothetical protein
LRQRPANRKGKPVYTDEVLAALRMVWVFSWYKCGKILAPLMRRQMKYIAGWPAFHITPETAEKLIRISPTTIDRYLNPVELQQNVNKAILRLRQRLAQTNRKLSLKQDGFR